MNKEVDKSYPFYVWSGLLAPRHRKRMGAALWEFLWCINKTTGEDNGEGIVLGGKEITIDEIRKDLGTSYNTTHRHIQQLSDFNYISAERGQRGVFITIPVSKRGKNSIEYNKMVLAEPSKNGESDTPKMGNDNTKNGESGPPSFIKNGESDTPKMGNDNTKNGESGISTHESDHDSNVHESVDKSVDKSKGGEGSASPAGLQAEDRKRIIKAYQQYAPGTDNGLRIDQLCELAVIHGVELVAGMLYRLHDDEYTPSSLMSFARKNLAMPEPQADYIEAFGRAMRDQEPVHYGIPVQYQNLPPHQPWDYDAHGGLGPADWIRHEVNERRKADEAQKVAQSE